MVILWNLEKEERRKMKKILSILMTLLIILSTFTMFTPQAKAQHNIVSLPAGCRRFGDPSDPTLDESRLLIDLDIAGQGQTSYVDLGETVSATCTFQIYSGAGNPSEINQGFFIMSWTPSWPPSSEYYRAVWNGISGVYPGMTRTESFSFPAPTTPGTYYLYWCGEAHYSIPQAVNSYDQDLGVPGTPAHAKIVVESGQPPGELVSLPDGAKNIDPTNPNLDESRLLIEIDIGGQGQTAYVNKGETVSGSCAYQIYSGAGNPSEINQGFFVMSWTPSWPATSGYYIPIWNGISGVSPGVTNLESFSFTAPTTPGTYYLYWCGGAEYSLADAVVRYNQPLTLPAHAKIVVGSPWEDSDGDGIENFLDLEGSEQSLVDHGFDETLIDVSTAVASFWKWDIEFKVYILWPETEDDVTRLTEWVKEQTSSEDYDFITSDLEDHHIPFTAIVEVPKSFLAKIWPVGFAFELLPADSTDNKVRWMLTIGYSDLDTFANIYLHFQDPHSIPQNVLAKLAYSFPCITDGEEKISEITGELLWFRFTRPYEFSRDNVGKFALGLVISLLGLIVPGSTAAEIASHIGSFFFSFISDYVYEMLLQLEQLEESLLQRIADLLLVKLADLQGDVDSALFIDNNFVLGSHDNTTITNSTYGEYLGDFLTELLFIYPDEIVDHDATIVLSTQNIVQPENISLNWLSFKDGDLAANGTFEEQISEISILPLDYEIEWTGNTPFVVPEFQSSLALQLFMIATLLAAIFYKRKTRIFAHGYG